MKVWIKLSLFWAGSLLVFACNTVPESLPFLGPPVISASGDTLKHRIPAFTFASHLGDSLGNKELEGKIYVADFFFTSCPTICPIMKSQMLRVHQYFKENEQVRLLSFTIDPVRDTVEKLQEHAEGLGVEGEQWQFLTGDQDAIYDIAAKGFMVSAMEDSSAIEDGGFIHSGAFLLIDRKGHVRGQYDGTVEVEVNQLIRDMELLLREND